MAKALKADKPAKGKDGSGHNSKALSQDEREALLVHHLTKLRAQKKLLDEKKAAAAAEASTFTEMLLQAKADGGFLRKELVELLTDSASRAKDLVAAEERRLWMRRAAGLPVGAQLDMFGDATTPTEAKDELAWEADGYLAGRRADDATPPKECDPRFHQAWMKGYHAGQAFNVEQLGKAKEVLARKPEPKGSLKAAEPDEEPDPQAEAAAAAKKLKANGWMEPAPAEAEFA